jgi:tetratricopeptide (TPR) repeat protein
MHRPAIFERIPTETTAPTPAPPKQVSALLLAILLGLATIVLYWPATQCDFISYDDPDYVTANDLIQNGISFENLRWALTSFVSANWHPITIWSHMLDCQLFGIKPWGHHLTSVVLHALNTALVFLFLRGLTGAVWRSVLVAVLFAIHPLRVESVAWVSERKDVLSTFFGLLTLICYTRYVQNVSSGKWQVASDESADASPVTRHPSLFYALALVCFALGLMSKSMLVTWPFVLLLLDYWPLNRIQNSKFKIQSFKQLLLEKIPFLALAAAACVATFIAQKGAGAVSTSLSLAQRFENVPISYCRYLGKMFWPTNLAIFYPHPGNWPMAEVLLACLFLAVVSGLLLVNRRRYPFLFMGWLWFIGTLVPVIGLVQVGSQSLADRYTYVPSLGVLVLVVWGMNELVQRWRYLVVPLSVAGAVVIVLCIEVTRHQLGYWQDSEMLFRHTLTVTQNNFLAHNILGAALGMKGQTDEAIRHCEEAIRIKPDYAEAHSNLGNALLIKGQTGEAIDQYQQAIQIKPDFADAHYNLGNAFLNKGQVNEAIGQYKEAIRLKSYYAAAYIGLGNALDNKGQTDEAIDQFHKAIQIKPDSADAHYNLGNVILNKGKADEAAGQYQEAIRFEPEFAEAHYNLGNIFLKKGLTEEAINQYQEAIRFKPDLAEAHYNLGGVLLHQGQFNEAVGQYQEVIRLRPDFAEAHYYLGNTFLSNGQTDEAISQYQQAIRLKPDFTAARNQLANVMVESGSKSNVPTSVSKKP